MQKKDLAANHRLRSKVSIRPSSSKGLDFGFIPVTLLQHCNAVIASHHAARKYPRLSDVLWKAELGEFIESHPDLRRVLRRSAINRSSKAANSGFISIAASLLSLELLASNFTIWGVNFSTERSMATNILRKNTRWGRTWLMEEYIYNRNEQLFGSVVSSTAAVGQPANDRIRFRSKLES
jgi:hypothetical protein